MSVHHGRLSFSYSLIFCGFLLSTASARAAGSSCWDYDLEGGGKPSHGGFSSMKDKGIFAGKSQGSDGGGNPGGVAYSNLGTQGEPDEGGSKGRVRRSNKIVAKLGRATANQSNM